MTSTLRASCVRCNAVLGEATFEHDWSFARCAACGARSPVPETVRKARPDAFTGGIPRALADVIARRPRDVVAEAGAEGARLWIRANSRFSVRRVLTELVSLAPPDALRALVGSAWSVEVVVITVGDRVRVESAPEIVLAEPIVHAVRASDAGFEIVIRGGHPICEEWVVGAISDHAHAEWVAEWIAAHLRAHLASTRTAPSARAPRAYRR